MKKYFAKSIDLSGKGIFKPYLCSKDIQVGDLVFVPNEEEAGNVTDDTDLTYWKEKNSYKVIGEISPEATWVKEGDEFDEEDFKIIALDSANNWESRTIVTSRLAEIVKRDHPDVYHEGVIMKSPCCGTFK